MKPRRTHESNRVFSLPGGTEDNDLWVNMQRDADGDLEIRSTWEPTDDERQAIAAGANIELLVYNVQPPCALLTTEVPLGKPPE